ncbi:hypothetical protein HPB51_026769 [Rhipicephalus microplus]|uniref:Uncharacterized protein n=1 Tax=Rhipicephalus microplus TaxID=6941 RepID=A0A9J6D2L0_RHIMP|nr:hypothetical protein HPB51_026769 [Rhipicephalus microplus]
MPDGDCCVLCSGPISDTEDYRHCEHCDQRAHVSCISSSAEEENLQVLRELQNSGEMSSLAGPSPMPNEVSSVSSAVSVEIPAVAVHPQDYMDGRPAAVQHLIPNAQKGIRHLENELADLRTKNERQHSQLEWNRILQDQGFAAMQLEVRSLREELASERVPAPVRPSMAPYESSPKQGELLATPPADGPAFGDTDDEEDY